ncbi:uncharacterized protein [Petaurus breviceps papuanus]
MDFDVIELYFYKDSKDNERCLFNMTAVGESRYQDGMHLKLKNQEATLVIQNTQFSHHGVYRWLLLGQGSSNKFTTLHVSEPPMISKENGSLICRALLVKAGRRIVWFNDVPTGHTEFISKKDATGLFNLSSSQPWNDSFYSNPPCCKVVDEKGSQQLCAQTCYTSSISGEFSGTPVTSQSNKQWLIVVIVIAVLILAAIVFYRYPKKRQFTNPASFKHSFLSSMIL